MSNFNKWTENLILRVIRQRRRMQGVCSRILKNDHQKEHRRKIQVPGGKAVSRSTEHQSRPKAKREYRIQTIQNTDQSDHSENRFGNGSKG